MEPYACNYDDTATIDDGSCDYDCNCENLSVCDGLYIMENGNVECQFAVGLILYVGAAPTSWEACNICLDTDGGSVDSQNADCKQYETNPEMCEQYDDDDFASATMCCACNGGEPTAECIGEVCLTLEACPGDNSCHAGCIDETACNYDYFAAIDDGTCDYDCIKGSFWQLLPLFDL